jgi:hypothetical protein
MIKTSISWIKLTSARTPPKITYLKIAAITSIVDVTFIPETGMEETLVQCDGITYYVKERASWIFDAIGGDVG